MRLAAHQPNYAPWCGTFAKMNSCDVFVFLDDVQMPQGRSYVHRTRVRSTKGEMWLSIPRTGEAGCLISNVGFAEPTWVQKHLKTLQMTYGRCAYFSEIFAWLQPLYLKPCLSLAKFNIRLNVSIAEYLGLPCHFELSSQLQPQGSGDDRLISLTLLMEADTYVSGKGGQNYQDPEKFLAHGINLEEHEYRPVPYTQIHGEFIPGLSILDALFHLGKQTIDLLDYPMVGPT